MDVNKYWRAVREAEKGLPGGPDDPVYIVSIDNELAGTAAGKVSAASREYAARWIAGATHKLASVDEIDRYHSELRARTDAINRTELEKKQTVRLETAVSDDQLQRALAVALADRDVKPAKPDQKPARS
jgi:hypothetical protein